MGTNQYLFRDARSDPYARNDPNSTNDTYDQATATITRLRANIKKDNVITFADLDEIRNLINSVRLHQHSYADYEAIKDFENNGVGTIGPTYRLTDYGIDVTAGGMTGSPADPFASFSTALGAGKPEWRATVGFAQNSTIRAVHHNAFASNCNIMPSHNHYNLNDWYWVP